MMANSARDPYWHAAVRREVTDHPVAQRAIEDKCATCHMPMARFDSAARGESAEVFGNLERVPANPLADDGVSCTVCHQIAAANFGEHASFDGGFEIPTGMAPGERQLFGPHAVDRGRQAVMHSATTFVQTETTHLQRSELCATCHTLFTTALDASGEVIGELPEQVPYQEWLHSEYRETHSCQSCHMPEVTGEAPIASVLGQPRPRLSQHTFRGANAFMLSILNKYRSDLGVVAMPRELDAAVQETKAYLQSAAASVTIESAKVTGNELTIDVAVASSTGHKLPTAYPSRRAWLHLRISDPSGRVLFESGALAADGSIVGNDNDADALAFEPHYLTIDAPDQVQIYESIMVDQNGGVTTGLLRGMSYVKDNRILPRGFDKATASDDVAVRGDAKDDPDFVAGSDRIRYRITLAENTSDLSIDAALMYQSIGYRWAENLRAYDARETQRFVKYYAETAAASSVSIATDALLVTPP